MTYKLLITELAQNDLDEIVYYIAVNLVNPDAAGRLLTEMSECFDNLKDNPFIYAKSSDLRLENEGYRKAVVGNYIIMFKISESEKTVTVHRIFYGRSDYFNLL